MLFGTGSTRPSWYYIFILLGIFGRQACVSCVSSLRLHGALVALAFTVFHYHFLPHMPTLLHKDVTNHECNWRTVMHQLFLRCGWLFIEATSHSNAYFSPIFGSIAKCSPQKWCIFICIFQWLERLYFYVCQATNFSRFLATGGLGSSAYDNQTRWTNQFCSWIFGNPRTWSKVNNLKQVEFSFMFAAHCTIIMIWMFGAAVVFKGFQYLEAKRSKRNISQDSIREILGNAWKCMVLPCFCLKFLWFSMLEMLWIPTSRLGSSSKVSFSEHNLASLLQTTCSLPDGWRLISHI